MVTVQSPFFLSNFASSTVLSSTSSAPALGRRGEREREEGREGRRGEERRGEGEEGVGGEAGRRGEERREEDERRKRGRRGMRAWMSQSQSSDNNIK